MFRHSIALFVCFPLFKREDTLQALEETEFIIVRRVPLLSLAAELRKLEVCKHISFCRAAKIGGAKSHLSYHTTSPTGL